MSDENTNKKVKCGCDNFGGGAYGLGFVGALIYFIQNADTFKVALIGVFKAIFWPAFLIYEIFGFLGM